MYAKFIVMFGRIVFGEDAEVRARHRTGPPDWRTGPAPPARAEPDWHCVRYSIHPPKTECRDRSEDSLGEILLLRINKDLPTLYALLFQNTSLEPGVVLHFLSHFIFIFRVED